MFSRCMGEPIEIRTVIIIAEENRLTVIARAEQCAQAHRGERNACYGSTSRATLLSMPAYEYRAQKGDPFSRGIPGIRKRLTGNTLGSWRRLHDALTDSIPACWS
jgi:hypothetical protein